MAYRSFASGVTLGNRISRGNRPAETAYVVIPGAGTGKCEPRRKPGDFHTDMLVGETAGIPDEPASSLVRAVAYAARTAR